MGVEYYLAYTFSMLTPWSRIIFFIAAMTMAQIFVIIINSNNQSNIILINPLGHYIYFKFAFNVLITLQNCFPIRKNCFGNLCLPLNSQDRIQNKTILLGLNQRRIVSFLRLSRCRIESLLWLNQRRIVNLLYRWIKRRIVKFVSMRRRRMDPVSGAASTNYRVWNKGLPGYSMVYLPCTIV